MWRSRSGFRPSFSSRCRAFSLDFSAARASRPTSDESYSAMRPCPMAGRRRRAPARSPASASHSPGRAPAPRHTGRTPSRSRPATPADPPTSPGASLCPKLPRGRLWPGSTHVSHPESGQLRHGADNCFNCLSSRQISRIRLNPVSHVAVQSAVARRAAGSGGRVSVTGAFAGIAETLVFVADRRRRVSARDRRPRPAPASCPPRRRLTPRLPASTCELPMIPFSLPPASCR